MAVWWTAEIAPSVHQGAPALATIAAAAAERIPSRAYAYDKSVVGPPYGRSVHGKEAEESVGGAARLPCPEEWPVRGLRWYIRHFEAS